MIAALLIAVGLLLLSLLAALGVGKAVRIADERDGALGLRGDR